MAHKKKHIPKKHPDKALTPAFIRNAKPGKHADGNGLYLVVDESGAKRWSLRTVIHRKRHELGLGGLNLVSLSEAREEAARLRKIARKHGDPLAERRRERTITPAFEAAAREVHASHSQTFRNPKHASQWITTLETYAFPTMGNIPIDKIESKEILAALSPIWIEKPETARRVKQRMKTVFDYAKAKGWRSGDNPVEGISRVLPKHSGKTKDHFAALPYAHVPDFIQALRASKVHESVKLAFEFLILTAARTSEVLLAKWDEIDLDGKVWIVPAERMKAKVEHRVPLSASSLEILKAAKGMSDGGEYVFPGRTQNHPLSNMAFLMVLRRMERTDITAHGFRSSFRDWAEEKTNTQRSVVEAALAHQVESKVEAAYLRTTLFDKRRRLMDSWTTFVLTKPAEKVVKMKA
jgi:integrase